MTPYHRPHDLQSALALCAAGPICVAAGCTDLYPLTPAKTLPGPVLDITAIPALRGISKTPNGIRIGATTTWTDILRADLPPAFTALKLAAMEVGSVQIQNTATVAGNLCTASPAADSVPCLMALEASVELASISGTRMLPLDQFLNGPRQTALQSSELVTAIHIPSNAIDGTSHFLKLGARKYLVISIAMVAARLAFDGDTIRDAAICVGACSPVAARLTELETALIGQPIANAHSLITAGLVTPKLNPIDDIRADRAYRLDAATELVRRAITALTDPAQRVAA